LRNASEKGSRLIGCQTRSAETSFILEIKWVFRSRLQLRDSEFNSEMNADSFKIWFVSRFINYLEDESDIIMGNDIYHSAVVDKFHNTGSHKKILKGDCKKLYLF
jgi:hypothetical protein